MLNFAKFKILTFDCYGTMINWESGIFSALRPILAAHYVSVTDSDLLAVYGELEAEAESGEFLNYREVLRRVVRGFGQRFGFAAGESEMNALPDSMSTWNPFDDTVAALERLQTRYGLAVISNVDDDLFAASGRKLRVAFRKVITAQQARCYKPCLPIFHLALRELGTAPNDILHVGQSIYHDVIPAQSLGISTVWVNRPSPRPNIGAVKSAAGKPDVEVASLKDLADLAFASA